MLSMFSRLSIDDLLKEYRYLPKDLEKKDEGSAFRFKFNNHGCGVSEIKQEAINAYADEVKRGVYDNAAKDIKLKLIDLFTIYANHSDQQTSHLKTPKLPGPLKEKKVQDWLETAFIIAQSLIPMQELLNGNALPELLKDNKEELSSISLMLHYLGKARRYNNIPAEQRLPLLETAFYISKHLVDDPHFYSDRVKTFAMPIIYSLRDMGELDKVAAIVQEQLQQSAEEKNYYHVIQSNVQLSEIYREKYEKTGLGIEDSLQCAKAAIHCVRTTTAVEDFTNHVIHFNAKTALMKAYSACNETDEAKSIAENIINEYEANPNCGAKPLHLEAAETILAQVGCSLAP